MSKEFNNVMLCMAINDEETVIRIPVPESGNT